MRTFLAAITSLVIVLGVVVARGDDSVASNTPSGDATPEGAPGCLRVAHDSQQSPSSMPANGAGVAPGNNKDTARAEARTLNNGAAVAPGSQASTVGQVRFAWVDVCVDPQGQGLAAYQFELKTTAGDVKIVGIEGGEHPAFAEPPYYDPAALSNNRVIIATFNTGKDLPAGKTRVARIHVRIAGPVQPEYAIDMQVAAGADGQSIFAVASYVQGEAQ